MNEKLAIACLIFLGVEHAAAIIFSIAEASEAKTVERARAAMTCLLIAVLGLLAAIFGVVAIAPPIPNPPTVPS